MKERKFSFQATFSWPSPSPLWYFKLPLFTVYDAMLERGANTDKITVNAWNFGPLGTAITMLQRGRFPTFATTLNSLIDIIHSTENKAIRQDTTSVNSNYESSHMASNFMVICIMLI